MHCFSCVIHNSHINALLQVSGSYDQTVKVWDMKTGVNTLTLRGHDSWVDAVKVDASHGSVLSASWDGTVKLWDIRDQPR